MAHQTVPVPSSPISTALISAALDLSFCQYEDSHGEGCAEDATVHHLASETEYCAFHYRELLAGQFTPWAVLEARRG